MKDQDKTREQLLSENEELRRRVTELESSRIGAGKWSGRWGLGNPQWHSLVANTPVFILIIDQDGCIHFANHTDSGATPEQIIGKNLCNFCAPENRENIRGCVQRVFRTGMSSLREGHGFRLDGKEGWYASYYGPIFADGKVVAVSVISVNVTDRNYAEQALRESERRLSTLMSNLPGMAYRCKNDLHWTMEFISDGCLPLLGYNASQMLGDQAIHLGDLIHPDDRQSVWEQVQQAIAERRRFQLTYRIGTAQAEEKWVWEQGVGVFSERGDLEALEGFITDISESRRAEEAFKKVRDELERRVEERTGELQEANERLQQEVEERRRSEATLDAFFLASPAILSILDEDFHCLKTDRLTPTYFGLDSQSIVGKSAKELAPEWFEEYGAMLNRVIETGEPVHNMEVKSPAPIRLGEMSPIRPGEMVCWRASCFAISLPEGKRGCGIVAVEITDMKRAEAALRQSEEKYRTLVETSPDGVLMADLKGHLTFASSRVLETRGDERAEDLMGKPALDFIAKQDHPRFLGNLRRTVEEGITRDIEYSFLNKDGSFFPGEISAAVVRDGFGQPYALVAVVRDIVERKRSQEALRQSHDELRAIYNGMFTGLLVIDFETKRLVKTNPAICRMLGYSEAELLSRSLTDIHPPEELPAVLERLQARAEGRFQGYSNVHIVRKDGQLLDAEIVANILTYGGRSCIVGFFRDVTERKQAEAALAESEAKYRQLVETTDTGYLILDDEGRVVDANGEYVRISSHHDLGEIVGHSVVEWTAPYDRDRNAQEVENCVRVGQVRQLEIDYIGPDGKVIPIEINASTITTKTGKRILSLCRDITERRQAQKALERERQSLWRMLQASDHERQIISYDIHDGLAQYLAAAWMQFQSCDALRENSPDDARKAYETALELVRQAHSESRRLISEVRPPVIDENGIEMAISHLVHEQRRHGGPKIECHSSVQFGRLPAILENAIYRIVQEALTNACKHSRSKAVKLTLAQDGQDVRLEVQDWGIGFDLDSVEKGHFGLEGIRQRVRLLGGRLTIESTPGSGTRVEVVVPIVEKQNDE
jgi:PAS domain S-box-containing protein